MGQPKGPRTKLARALLEARQAVEPLMTIDDYAEFCRLQDQWYENYLAVRNTASKAWRTRQAVKDLL